MTRPSDDTWLSSYGTFHPHATHVIKRITRKGDTLQYSATVHDPKVLTKPRTTAPPTKVLAAPDEKIEGDVPCGDNDSQYLVGLIHY